MAVKIKKGYVSAKELAKSLGTNQGTISQYRKRDIITDFYMEARAYYYHLENSTNEVRTKVKGASGKEATADENEQLARENIPTKAISQARHEHYKAEKARIEYERQKGQYIDLDDFKKGLLGEARAIRDQFDSFSDRLAPILSGVDDPVKITNIIDKELNQILGKLFERFID